jgi:hypothetical protein
MATEQQAGEKPFEQLPLLITFQVDVQLLRIQWAAL